MTSEAAGPPARRPGVPPPQHNFQQAADRALAAAREQKAVQIHWLGGEPLDGRWRLAVLDDVLSIDLYNGKIRTSAGRAVAPVWRILVLHYLATSTRPDPAEPSLTFASFPAARGYTPVYQQRVIERLCHTAGREAGPLDQACRKLGGRPIAEGDVGFDFQVFPRLAVRLIWHAGDDELPPSAVLLLPENVEAFLSVEDVVVLSERIVSRLSGGTF